MSWELISSIMVIMLPADYLTATQLPLPPPWGSPSPCHVAPLPPCHGVPPPPTTRLSCHGAPLIFSFARGSEWGPLCGPLLCPPQARGEVAADWGMAASWGQAHEI